MKEPLLQLVSRAIYFSLFLNPTFWDACRAGFRYLNSTLKVTGLLTRPFVTTLLEEMSCSHYHGLIPILFRLELSSCEISAWSSEAENWGRLGSEMGSAQQEWPDQSRGEKQVRGEIKAQEVSRYTVQALPGTVACGRTPAGECLRGRAPELALCQQVPGGFFVIDLGLSFLLTKRIQLVNIIWEALCSPNQINFKILEAALF